MEEEELHAAGQTLSAIERCKVVYREPVTDDEVAHGVVEMSKADALDLFRSVPQDMTPHDLDMRAGLFGRLTAAGELFLYD